MHEKGRGDYLNNNLFGVTHNLYYATKVPDANVDGYISDIV